ncbi:MAG: nickel-responsive transcriptional regulator NikR [Pyramidobacter sp.]|jgi:CopG family nickel-responsive transcriptional regulator
MRQKREKLMRFGVTVPQNLLSSFDERIKAARLPSRSEALRKLILEYVSRDTWQKGTGNVYGTITLTYNHHANDVMARLTDLQHDFGNIIVCTTHVHADHDHCLETVIVRGDVKSVKEFIAALRSLKAVSSVNPVIAVLV